MDTCEMPIHRACYSGTALHLYVCFHHLIYFSYYLLQVYVNSFCSHEKKKNMSEFRKMEKRRRKTARIATATHIDRVYEYVEMLLTDHAVTMCVCVYDGCH